MKQAILSQRIEQRIPVLRLEIDYALAELYEAIQTKNTQDITKIKLKLKELQEEMLILEI
jgi:hypothetical protein